MKEITLMYLFDLAIRRLWALILAAVVFAAGAFCYCKFLAVPQYSATASVLVTNGGIMTQESSNGKETISTTDINASVNLVGTVIDILKISDIYKALSEDLEGRYTYKQLKSRFSISEKGGNSMFVDVSFKSADPKEAVEIVNMFVEASPEYIVAFVPYSHVAVASTADSASLVFPQTTTTTATAGLVGIVFAYALVFLIDSFDQAISGEKDFTSHFDIPLIGTIPDFESIGVIAPSNYYQKGGSSNGY